MITEYSNISVSADELIRLDDSGQLHLINALKAASQA